MRPLRLAGNGRHAISGMLTFHAAYRRFMRRKNISLSRDTFAMFWRLDFYSGTRSTGSLLLLTRNDNQRLRRKRSGEQNIQKTRLVAESTLSHLPTRFLGDLRAGTRIDSLRELNRRRSDRNIDRKLVRSRARRWRDL